MKINTKCLPIERYEFNLDLKGKYKDIPITIFNDHAANDEMLKENPINILILNEPNEFFKLHDWAIYNQNSFDIIMTWSDLVHQNTNNSILFIHGETNLDKPYISTFSKNVKRKFEVTFLSGVLNKIEGHHLRRKLLQRGSEIKIPNLWLEVLGDFDHKRGQRPGYFEEKMTKHGNPIEGEGKKELWDRHSMFHVAIENSKYLNYYTDKILDCFATKTLPIYWGAPNIGEFYDKEGIITFDTEDELIDIVNNLTEEDYNSRLEAIEHNYKLVLEKGFYFDKLQNFLDELIEMNNLKP